MDYSGHVYRASDDDEDEDGVQIYIIEEKKITYKNFIVKPALQCFAVPLQIKVFGKHKKRPESVHALPQFEKMPARTRMKARARTRTSKEGWHEVRIENYW